MKIFLFLLYTKLTNFILFLTLYTKNICKEKVEKELHFQ